MQDYHVPEALGALRAKRPLVHHITNYVTANDCANVTMCIGAAPVMAEAKEEVEDMVELASALVLNIGTLRPEQVEAMLLAGRRANHLSIPVVLDPVGAGATPYRTRTALMLMEKLHIDVLKGNAGEIGVLNGSGGKVVGVDSRGIRGDPIVVAAEFARNRGGLVVISGATDIVSDGRRTLLVDNGHPLMGKVSGTGCMATSILASYLGTLQDPLLASVAALSSFGVAGEDAALHAKRPASFKIGLLDAVAALSPEHLTGRIKVRVV
ncbi:MAG: hydroxyethylthiazole kinase [Methanomassiliicoccales archaeon]